MLLRGTSEYVNRSRGCKPSSCELKKLAAVNASRESAFAYPQVSLSPAMHPAMNQLLQAAASGFIIHGPHLQKGVSITRQERLVLLRKGLLPKNGLRKGRHESETWQRFERWKAAEEIFCVLGIGAE